MSDDYEDDEVCGGMSPDDWCGVCSDCRDASADWREIHGEDGAP